MRATVTVLLFCCALASAGFHDSLFARTARVTVEKIRTTARHFHAEAQRVQSPTRSDRASLQGASTDCSSLNGCSSCIANPECVWAGVYCASYNATTGLPSGNNIGFLSGCSWKTECAKQCCAKMPARFASGITVGDSEASFSALELCLTGTADFTSPEAAMSSIGVRGILTHFTSDQAAGQGPPDQAILQAYVKKEPGGSEVNAAFFAVVYSRLFDYDAAAVTAGATTSTATLGGSISNSKVISSVCATNTDGLGAFPNDQKCVIQYGTTGTNSVVHKCTLSTSKYTDEGKTHSPDELNCIVTIGNIPVSTNSKGILLFSTSASTSVSINQADAEPTINMGPGYFKYEKVVTATISSSDVNREIKTQGPFTGAENCGNVPWISQLPSEIRTIQCMFVSFNSASATKIVWDPVIGTNSELAAGAGERAVPSLVVSTIAFAVAMLSLAKLH